MFFTSLGLKDNFAHKKTVNQKTHSYKIYYFIFIDYDFLKRLECLMFPHRVADKSFLQPSFV